MRRGLTGIGLMAALALLAVAAPQAEAGDLLRLGFGVARPNDSDFSAFYGMVALRLDMGENFAIEPEVGAWRKSEEIWGETLTTTMGHLGGSALFVLPGEKVDFFAGAGAAAHMVRVEAGDYSEDSEVKPGLHGLAGIEFKVSEGARLFGAIRYEVVDTDDNENLKQWKFYGGIRF